MSHMRLCSNQPQNPFEHESSTNKRKLVTTTDNHAKKRRSSLSVVEGEDLTEKAIKVISSELHDAEQESVSLNGSNNSSRSITFRSERLCQISFLQELRALLSTHATTSLRADLTPDDLHQLSLKAASVTIEKFHFASNVWPYLIDKYSLIFSKLFGMKEEDQVIGMSGLENPTNPNFLHVYSYAQNLVDSVFQQVYNKCIN
eukprot:TRINITY_DN17349_c0_g1_i1.p1 TRINITY_DN17349_c0_g1~~TRINITY_DN17349_c0_g1_i1.p1  ORF type:complete len:202 (-),score=29.04 TRINITY_DN17349_c0_g1_i1:9-614(-)